MELLHAIATTRAIRRYRADDIPPEDLATMFFAATRAPSGSNRQPLRFVVLRDGINAVAAKAVLGTAFRAGWALKVDADGYEAGSGQAHDSPKSRMRHTMQQFVDRFEQTPVVVLACLQRYRAPTPTEGGSVYPAVQNLLLAARALMSRIHERMEFNPRATDVATDALQALAKGQGVCQDFAHIMIGALRSLGLAARYVSGYLLTHPPAGQPRLIGADASHAWVEVWCPLNGWVPFDPTNDVLVGQEHVTLAWGRDYADVAPLRGVIRGGGKAPPEVSVTVEPVA